MIVNWYRGIPVITCDCYFWKWVHVGDRGTNVRLKWKKIYWQHWRFWL